MKTKNPEELPKTKVADLKEKENFVQSFFGFDNLRSLFILIVVILAFRHSVVSPYHVPTASMEPTIKVGDRLLAFKLAYSLKFPFTDFELANWSDPKRGDIIVFKYPKDPDIDYVKRVVGIAGDQIEVKENILFINGVEQKRTDHEFDRTILEDIKDQKEIKHLYKESLNGLDHWVIQNRPAQQRFTSSNWPPLNGPYVVPEDSVFVMGDNRDNSTDSRKWKEVPMSYIRGKALFVIWSMFKPHDENWPQFRWDRFGHVLD